MTTDGDATGAWPGYGDDEADHDARWARETALEQAVASSMPSAQTDEILTRAAAFEAFLNGTPLPQPPSAKGVQAGILAEDGSFQQL